MIPAGSWRENESALDDAGIFLIKTDPEEWPDLVPALKARLARRPRPVFAFRMAPAGLRPLGQDASGHADASLIPGPYLFVCGIGDPSQALHTATEFFHRPPERMLSFPDHHDFRKEKNALESSGLPVVCTGKDAVKIAPLNLSVPAFSLEVSAEFFASLSADAIAGIPAAKTETDFESWWTGWLSRHLG